MRFETCKKERAYIRLAEWVNMPQFYSKMSYEKFIIKQKEYRIKKKYDNNTQQLL